MQTMKNYKTLLILVWHLSFIGAYGQSDFYVSPFGDDSNSGTLEAPFKSIQKARDAVRQSITKAKGDHTVYLRGGTYWIDQTIKFDQRDSGEKNYKSIYQAYRDEKPVINGGVQIEGWEPHKNGIWKASVKGINFRQLYVNGQRAIRSRQPNSGDFHRLKAWDLAGERIIIDSRHITDWDNFETVEMVAQLSWAESILRLKSFELYGTIAGYDAYVTIQDEERDLLFPRGHPGKHNNQVFHFENAYEFLDAPGEWYLDLSAGLLFYMPRKGENMNYIEVIAPGVETLLEIEGTLDNPVKNLVFRGISFEHSTWTYPGEHGYLNMQSGQYDIKTESNGNQYVDRPPAGVTVIAAQNVLFERNLFQHMGSTAIDFFYGTKNCRIIGNIITDISGNGIAVGKFVEDKFTEAGIPYNPEDKREVCTNDVVSNNIVYRTGRDYFGTHGIVAGYPAGLTIEHNIVRDIPYSGISVGYGWTLKPNAMHDNLIAYNEISNVINLLADGAGIYMLSMQPGTKIIGNHIYNITRSKWAGTSPVAGIYLDEGTSGTKENPFILKENFIESPQRHNFHIIGEVVIDNDYFYNRQEKAKAVKAKAGLEFEYKDLKDMIFIMEEKEMITKDLVFMADLKNEKEAIEKYTYYHSAEGIWPEVVHAAKSSGIKKIKIYRFANHLVMIVTIPEDADMEEINRKYGESSSRIKEWGELMATFQQAPSGAGEDETFVPMELIHDYENGVVK